MAYLRGNGELTIGMALAVAMIQTRINHRFCFQSGGEARSSSNHTIIRGQLNVQLYRGPKSHGFPVRKICALEEAGRFCVQEALEEWRWLSKGRAGRDG